MAACVGEPGRADAFAQPMGPDPGADRLNDADDLVPGHDAGPAHRQVAVDHVEVGSADAAGSHLQSQFAGTGFARRPLLGPQPCVGAGERHGEHSGLPLM